MELLPDHVIWEAFCGEIDFNLSKDISMNEAIAQAMARDDIILRLRNIAKAQQSNGTKEYGKKTEICCPACGHDKLSLWCYWPDQEQPEENHWKCCNCQQTFPESECLVNRSSKIDKGGS